MSPLRKIGIFIEKVEERVGTASLLLMILMLIGKAAGFFKLHLIARFFGISTELDVFWAAFALPDFIFSLLVVGTVNAALIPVFIKILKKEEKKVLSQTLTSVLLILVALLILFGTVFYFLIPFVAHALFSGQEIWGVIRLDPVLSEASTEEYIQLYITLSRMMLASPFILSVSSILGAYLQSHKRFLYASLAPVAYNVGILAAIGFFTFFAPQFGIYSLGYAVIFGSLCHLLIQLPGIFALYTPTPIRLTLSKHVREIFKLSIPRVLGLTVEQFAVLFNTFLSFTLGAGALSAFSFANSLRALPVDLLSGSFLQAMFPHLNEAAQKDDDKEELKVLYFRALMLILIVGILLMVLVLILRMPIVRIIFGAGRFSWSATVVTSFVLAFFAPTILFQAIASLNIRTFYAINNTKVPFAISAVGVVLSILFSVFFTNFFSHYHDFTRLFSDFTSNPIAFDYIGSIISMFSWFIIRNQSFAAVAGLAFGLSCALFFEVVVSLALLSRQIKFTPFIRKNEYILNDIYLLVASGLGSMGIGYIVFRTLDEFVLNTAYTFQLIVLTVIVGIVISSVYIFLSKNVWRKYIIIEKYKKYFSRYFHRK
ncbi:MAG: lipid II flippase MurJ [Candidatus Dojkabacteria bacterium]|nr:MAG: lipid II flippase MurJ [Candidatus Dojkabacteria bacterium]